MWSLVPTTGGRVGEDGGTAVSTSFDEDCLGQFKVEVSSCLWWLVWNMRSMALQPPPFIPRGKAQRQLSDSNNIPSSLTWVQSSYFRVQRRQSKLSQGCTSWCTHASSLTSGLEVDSVQWHHSLPANFHSLCTGSPTGSPTATGRGRSQRITRRTADAVTVLSSAPRCCRPPPTQWSPTERWRTVGGGFRSAAVNASHAYNARTNTVQSAGKLLPTSPTVPTKSSHVSKHLTLQTKRD